MGKVRQVMFNKKELTDDRDVIQAGPSHKLAQQVDEQNVEVTNLSEADIKLLKQKHLLRYFKFTFKF